MCSMNFKIYRNSDFCNLLRQSRTTVVNHHCVQFIISFYSLPQNIHHVCDKCVHLHVFWQSHEHQYEHEDECCRDNGNTSYPINKKINKLYCVYSPREASCKLDNQMHVLKMSTRREITLTSTMLGPGYLWENYFYSTILITLKIMTAIPAC